MSDIIPHPAFDFGSYRHGDVLLIPRSKIIEKEGLTGAQIYSAIALAALKAGLLCEYSDDGPDVRISFKDFE